MRKILVIILLLSSFFSDAQSVINASSGYRATITVSSTLLNGLVADYEFDETSSPTIDYSPNNNDGIASNVTYGISGKINTAYQYNGTSSYVDCGNDASLQLSSAGSISCWINSANLSSNHAIVDKMSIGGDVNGFHLGTASDSTIYWELANASAFQGGNSISKITVNTWYHIVLTWDGSQVIVYINGSIDPGGIYPKTQTVTPISNVYNLRIGVRGDITTSRLFNGIIDEVGIWNRALTSTEVTTLYNSASGKAYPFSWLIIPMKYLGQPYKSDPVGVVIPIEKYFAILPKRIAA